MHHNNINTKDCFICQIIPSSSVFPIVVTHKSTDSLLLEQHAICRNCQIELTTIRNNTQTDNLKFGKGSQKGKQIINLCKDSLKYLNHLESAYSTGVIAHNNYIGYEPELQPFYNTSISNIIRKNNLYQTQAIPLTYKYLLYYSSINISSSERHQRHQRVRNTVLRVMVGHALPISAIQDISILVQILLCYFRDYQVYMLLGRISEMISELNEEGEQWKKLYTNIKGYQFIDIIYQIVKSGLDCISKSRKAEQNKNQTRQQKIKITNTPSKKTEQTSSSPLSSLRSMRKSTRRLSISSYNQSSQCNCQQIFNKESLKQIARMKNHCKLVIASLIQQQNNYKQYLKQIQTKNKKQKQEYINKIISLKQQINKLETIILNKNQSLVQVINNHTLQKISEQISKPIQKYPQPIETIQIESNTISKHLKNLVIKTEITEINFQQSQQQLFQSLQNNINKLKQQVKTLITKNKQSQQQVRRLLAILKRKQQKFVPLMHQKDQIIQMYENALWRLQNGLGMGDNLLSQRIQMIRKSQLQRYKLKLKEDLTVMEKKSQKKKQPTKQIKQIKDVNKIKEDSKQSCVIY